ncbi:hypothetical protein [Rhodococcus erythropolis]|uniref:hypothetical protein n=1 Tax=Rhodococcus erythropolis TaxID=1833 RepID=UPI00366C1DBA
MPHIFVRGGRSFAPLGMVKSGTFSTTSTSPVVVSGMVANAALTGSTVTSDALVSNVGGPVRIGFSIELTSSGGQTSTVGVYKNGVLVGTAVVDTVAYNGVTVMFGSVTTTVAVGDAITLRYNQASTAWSTTVAATVTRLNISAGDSVVIGGTTSADYTPAAGWTDVVFTPTAGTTMSGNAFVVPMAHPNAILTTVLPVRSDQAMAARILVNGSVVVTGPNTPAYDLRVRATTGVAVAAGDLVTVQVQRLSTFGTTVYAGAKFAIV